MKDNSVTQERQAYQAHPDELFWRLEKMIDTVSHIEIRKHTDGFTMQIIYDDGMGALHCGIVGIYEVVRVMDTWQKARGKGVDG